MCRCFLYSDIAEVSVEQAEIRYNDMKKTTQSDQLFTGEFITVDCSKVYYFFYQFSSFFLLIWLL